MRVIEGYFMGFNNTLIIQIRNSYLSSYRFLFLLTHFIDSCHQIRMPVLFVGRGRFEVVNSERCRDNPFDFNPYDTLHTSKTLSLLVAPFHGCLSLFQVVVPHHRTSLELMDLTNCLFCF